MANRVVPCGTGLDAALALAKEIAAFPQECMRTDRSSLYHSAYNTGGDASLKDGNWLKKALSFEFSNGVGVVQKESVSGAQSFVSGVGRKGIF